MTHEQYKRAPGPPVTAQELRVFANNLDICEVRGGQILRKLADWLQTYDEKQLGEAMELVALSRATISGLPDWYAEASNALLQEWERKDQ